MPIKAESVTYSFSTEEIKKLIGVDINTDPSKMKLTYKTVERGDDRFRMRPWTEVVGIEVTVKE